MIESFSFGHVYPVLKSRIPETSQTASLPIVPPAEGFITHQEVKKQGATPKGSRNLVEM